MIMPVAGGFLAYLATDAKALPDRALRPPGAVGEEDFLAACVRCGLAVHAGGSYRVVTQGSARAIVWPGHHGALPPCADGAVGAITTAREAAWLWCDP